MDSCYCGVDATAICQGPCGRRVCSTHAVHENSLRGLTRPLDDRLRQFPALDLVVQYGYAAGMGARCPKCRNADAAVALGAVPTVSSDDPIEMRVAQYAHFGGYLPFSGPWGPSWVAAAQRRGIPHGTYSINYRAWQDGPAPTVDDRPVWRFIEYEPGQVSSMNSSYGGDITVFQFDDSGNSPQWGSQAKRGRLRSTRHAQTLSWLPGPSRGELRFPEHRSESVLLSLMDKPPAHLWAQPNDSSWIGVAPDRIYSWLATSGR